MIRVLTFLLLGLLMFVAAGCPRPSPTSTSVPAVPSPSSAAAPTAFVPPVEAPPFTPRPSSPGTVLAPPLLPASFAPPVPPDRDLYELTRRLRLKGLELPPPASSPAPQLTVGQKETFWAIDLDQRRPYNIRAELRLVSEHAYWWVAEEATVSDDILKEAGRVFEQQIYPSNVRYFGEVWGSVPRSHRITILHGELRGAAGYYSSADEYPSVVNQYTNYRKMIYINTQGPPVGSRTYYAVLAHEFQHAIHWSGDPTEESWINEGLSELAAELAGYPSFLAQSFLRQPAVSLIAWPDEPQQSGPHYGAANLFFRYLSQHYGGPEKLRLLVKEPLDGVRGVDAYLARLGYSQTFKDVFRDWIIANALGQQGPGPYQYLERPVKVNVSQALQAPGEIKSVVPQFGTRYVTLSVDKGDALLTFHGQGTIPVLPTSPYSGESCWWSNRGDAINSRLTRPLDLRSVSQGTLEFAIWFDIEKEWDYGYVEVSVDGGRSWEVLQGQHTSPENPVGNSYGHGYTGSSNGWLRERIDLTPFAGRQVLLRFEYVTDDAINRNGFCLDDIGVQQAGFFDDAEGDAGWQAEGFVRLTGPLRQEYLVQVVEFPTQGDPWVRALALDRENRGQMLLQGFGTQLKSALVVIAGATPGTTQEALFTLALSSAP